MNNSNTIANPITSHTNNLDFLRLFFALSVLVTHSYALTGLPENDVLSQFSHGQATLSHTGVCGFLIISGYLITKSFRRSPSLLNYYLNRVLRVFPGLLATLCFTVVLCFFFSGKSILLYFSHYSTRDYVFYNMLLNTKYQLDGVFSNNPYPSAVNGSLWTIPYEVFFYIVLSLCFSFRRNRRLLLGLFVGAFVLSVGLFLTAGPALRSYEVPLWHLLGNHIAELGAFFLSGAIWALVPIPSPLVRQKIAVGATILLLSSWYVGGYALAQFIALPLLIIAFGTLNTPALSFARKYGDFSYGIYLWGFVVQQILAHLFRLGVWEMMLASIPLTYLMGAASWHLVEKRALQYKTRNIALQQIVTVPL